MEDGKTRPRAVCCECEGGAEATAKGGRRTALRREDAIGMKAYQREVAAVLRVRVGVQKYHESEGGQRNCQRRQHESGSQRAALAMDSRDPITATSAAHPTSGGLLERVNTGLSRVGFTEAHTWWAARREKEEEKKKGKKRREARRAVPAHHHHPFHLLGPPPWFTEHGRPRRRPRDHGRTCTSKCTPHTEPRHKLESFF